MSDVDPDCIENNNDKINGEVTFIKHLPGASDCAKCFINMIVFNLPKKPIIIILISRIIKLKLVG